VAGFVATLVFHHGLLGAYHLAGLIPRVPWGLAPVPPFGVPQVISLAFWGGLWGVALALLARRLPASPARWAVRPGVRCDLPFAGGLYVVAPLKTGSVGFNAATAWVGLTLNGLWGLGTELFLRWPRTAKAPKSSLRA
jgi:hypothetical protein